MKYIALLGLALLVTGCDQVKQLHAGFVHGTPATACENVMQPELCRVIVGCGDMPNMQVCEMQTRSMCQGPIETATSLQIVDCAKALHKISCEDSLPKECWNLD